MAKIIPNRILLSTNTDDSALVYGMDYYRPSVANRMVASMTMMVTGQPFTPPRIVDVHQYYPEGTIDWDYLQNNNIIVQISCGIGVNQSPRYLHQIEEARKRNLPIAIWHIPDANHGMVEQVQEVMSWPYVKDYLFCMDVEKPRSTTRVINQDEFRWYAQELEKHTLYLPMVYSTVSILTDIFGNQFPSWYQYWHWIAQYVYENYPYLYEYFSNFEAVYGCTLPPAVKASPLFADQVHRDSVVEWQFTHKGKEPFVFPGGPLSRDLSTGIVPSERLLSDVIHWYATEPEPIDVGEIVRLHSLALNASYISDVEHYNDLAGWMKANHQFPDVSGKSLEERHITEAIAQDLGITIQPYLYKGIVNTGSGLRVRNAPTLNGSVIRVLPFGTEITVYEENSDSPDVYTWGKIDIARSEWAAVSHNLIRKI